MRYQRICTAGVTTLTVLATLGGCAKKEAAPADPEFDRRWSALATGGNEALYIEDDRGEGLMGNVRRATKPQPVPVLPPGESPAGSLPEQPNGDDVQKVIRSNLAAVKGCYMLMARAGSARSGKAILTFGIGADGKPADVAVDAPQFRGTALPNCMMGQVARWTFPKSQKGGGSISYPFVFVGG
jgi:hypothetical protein